MKEEKSKQTDNGMITKKWDEKKLGEEIELCYGRGLPENKRVKGNTPVFGSNGVVGFHNEFLVEGPGIILGRKGSVGEIKFSKSNFWPIDTTYYVKLKKKGDIRFWYYFLFSLKLNKMNSHSAVPGLNREQVYELVKKIPPYNEQLLISKILSDLDSKIGLNQQMNKTLESIGQAIFKHWFIDFEFPNEEGKPYKSSEGKMFYNEELGKEIPKGWNLIPLDQVAEFTRGFSYKGSEKSKTDGKYLFITLNSVKEFGGFKREFSYITSNRIKEKHFVRHGDIIIANTEQTKTGTLLGYPALVEFPFQYGENKGIFSHHITKVTPKLENLKQYLYNYLFIYQQNAVKYHTGSVIWALDVNNWSKNETITLPPQEILQKFESLMRDIFIKISEDNLQIETLSCIRDSLLPKLMSGKIRVSVEA